MPEKQKSQQTRTHRCQTAEGSHYGGGSVIRQVPCRSERNHVYAHGITSLRTEAEMNGRRSKNKLLKSALQELCAVESTADDAIVDGSQCLSHRFCILYIWSKFRVNRNELRSLRSGDAQQLKLGNNRRPAGFQNFGELP